MGEWEEEMVHDMAVWWLWQIPLVLLCMLLLSCLVSRIRLTAAAARPFPAAEEKKWKFAGVGIGVTLSLAVLTVLFFPRTTTELHRFRVVSASTATVIPPQQQGMRSRLLLPADESGKGAAAGGRS